MVNYQEYSIETYESSISILESEFAELHNQQLSECKKKGEEDGYRNLPEVSNEEITPYERGTIAKYQALVEKQFVHGRQILDEIHDRNYLPLKEKLDDKKEKEIEKILDLAEKEKLRKLTEEDLNHKDKLKEIHNTPEWISTNKELEKTNLRFKEVSKRLGREELHIQLRPFWLYIILIVGLGIAELPLNNQVFISFRDTPLLTLIMSLVLVISLPFLAHGSGKFLRQGKENKTFYYLLFLSIILIISISYLTAVLRTNYLAIKGVAIEELETDKWIFFVIGLILFFVGMIASYFAHDASIAFSEVYRSLQKTKNKHSKVEQKIHILIKEEKQRNQNYIREIQNVYSKENNRILNEVETLKRIVHNIKGDYDRILNSFMGLEKKLNQYCKEAIHHYRDTNLTYRSNHAQPNSWKKEIPELKLNFQNINELSVNPSN